MHLRLHVWQRVEDFPRCLSKGEILWSSDRIAYYTHNFWWINISFFIGGLCCMFTSWCHNHLAMWYEACHPADIVCRIGWPPGAFAWARLTMMRVLGCTRRSMVVKTCFSFFWQLSLPKTSKRSHWFKGGFLVTVFKGHKGDLYRQYTGPSQAENWGLQCARRVMAAVWFAWSFAHTDHSGLRNGKLG